MCIFDELNTDDPYGIGLKASTDSLLASVTSAGALVGIPSFVFIVDRIGWNLGMIVTGLLVKSGSVASSLFQGSDQLVRCQVILGIPRFTEHHVAISVSINRSLCLGRIQIMSILFAVFGVRTISHPLWFGVSL